ncbi:MAG: hypothetical protein RIF32_20395, partial [Leptospirales bacterium]
MQRSSIFFVGILISLICGRCQWMSFEEYRFGPLEFKGAAVAHVHRHGAGYGSGRTESLYGDLKT